MAVHEYVSYCRADEVILGRLTQKVIYSSSEDVNHPSVSLGYTSAVSAQCDKFWLSAEGHKYPQSLILSLEGLSKLSQIQILSHESCIASRIDILTHEKSGLEYNSSVDDLKFRKLGHVNLDQNDQTSWKARELKSVFVNISCCMVKLILHEPVPNKLNHGNQVGIVSVSMIGERAQDSPIRSGKLTDVEPSMGFESASLKPDIKNERILSQIESLEAEKREAVLVEDYDTAKSIKLKIDGLKKQLDAADSKKADRVTGKKSSEYGLSSMLPNFGGSEQTEALPAPDPLPSYFSRDYPQLIEALGEERVSEILSRDWRLRDKGISAFISDMYEKNEIEIYGVNWIVRKCISDKVVNVFLKVCDLLQQVATLESDPPSSGDDMVSEIFEFAAISLVDHRLIDGNKKLVDAVIVTLVKLAGFTSNASHSILKGRPNSKQINARCLCLMSLIESVGFKGKKSSLSLESLVQVVAEWYKVSVGETRHWVVQVLRCAVKTVGGAKVEVVLNSLEAGVREDLLYEISRIQAVNRGAFTPRSIPSQKDAFKCDFCGISNPEFTDENTMDLHYWQHCPALVECQFCEQVVELTGLTEHRLKECDQGHTNDLFPLI